MRTESRRWLFICCCFLEDVLIFSRTLDGHLAHLQPVLNRIIRQDWIWSHQSVSLFNTKSSSMKLNPNRVATVKDYPKPHTLRNLDSSLACYHRFIRQFAKIAQPLPALTSKNVDYVWTTECQAAFNEFKEKLISAPLPKFWSQFHTGNWC